MISGVSLRFVQVSTCQLEPVPLTLGAGALALLVISHVALSAFPVCIYAGVSSDELLLKASRDSGCGHASVVKDERASDFSSSRWRVGIWERLQR